VIISDNTIHYPYVRHPDILVCMSQGGYDRFSPLLREDSTLILDEDLVQPRSASPAASYAVPATRFAEELGRKMMANIVMVGFFTAITEALSATAARRAVADAVPKNTVAMNLAAFDRGQAYGQALLKGREKKAAGRKGARG
jgi:2-oxoglutarate ferredoxin oxidoreductase subunit gamma